MSLLLSSHGVHMTDEALPGIVVITCVTGSEIGLMVMSSKPGLPSYEKGEKHESTNDAIQAAMKAHSLTVDIIRYKQADIERGAFCFSCGRDREQCATCNLNGVFTV